MKIINKTCWQTKHLRAFALRCAKAECTPEKRKRLIVEFVPGHRQNCFSGYAFVGGRYARVRVPTRIESFTDDMKIRFARLIAHELAHCHGKHGERWMRKNARYGRSNTERGHEISMELYAWAKDLPMERKPVKVKSKKTPDNKLSGIEARISRWESKRKRAETAIKKLRRQRSYYQKKAAAMPAEKEVQHVELHT